MPLRRPSASIGPSSNATNVTVSHSTRVHKSNDSYMFSGSQPNPLALGSLATPQQKIVQVLVNRLKHKLPCNSGLSLDRLEADSATQQAIESLVDLANDSLDIIAWALSELLDRLAKQTDSSGLLTIEVLQSQLFILKVLSVTMASRWNNNPRSNSQASHYPQSPDSPVPDSSSKRNRQASSEHLPTTNGTTWTEPPPMDDNCAKYILSVMVLFLRQTASPESPLMLSSPSSDITFRDFGTNDLPAPTHDTRPDIRTNGHSERQGPGLRNQPSSGSVKSGKMSVNSAVHNPAANAKYERTHMSMVKSSLSVNALIAKFAGRIIFHISASNWSVVFHRLRNKIHFLAGHPEENPDTVDLKLMAHSALDRQRLVQVLNELSSLLVSMGSDARLAIAGPLRSAIWSWIDLFPGEFDDAIRTRGRTEGAPERVFDLLYSLVGNGNEREFWPTLTILNCTTSDRISSDIQALRLGIAPPTSKAHRKDFKFSEDVMKHANSNSKLAEVALVCALDMCRAATHVRPEGEVPLRLLAYDIAHELKSVLSLSSTKKPFWESYEEIDVAMYAEAMVSIFRFLPLEDSIPLFTVCVEPERSEAVKTCATRACLTLVQEAPRLTWQKPLERLEDMMAHRFREIFKTAGIRRPEVDQYGNSKRSATRPKAKRTVAQPLSDREVLLSGILSLWRASPMFYLRNMKEDDIDEWVNTAVKLWEAPIDTSVKVSTASCFGMVAEMTYALAPTEPYYPLLIRLMKSCLPATLLSIVTNLIHARTDAEAQRLWIGLTHQTVELFMRKSDNEHVKEIQYDAGRVPAFALTEIALLVSLTSADINVSQLAGKGLRLLSHAERQDDAPINPTVTDGDRSKRNPVYEQMGDPRVAVVGRIGHQKRIRKLIRLISSPSAVHVAVWQECYWRWRSLSEYFEFFSENREPGDVRRAQSAAHQEQRFQWQNLTLFLAALSGACVHEDLQLTSLSAVIPAQFLPDEMRVLQNPVPLVTNFITHLTNLLVSPDHQVREVARDALGMELSPRLYGRLLKYLDETMHSIEQGAGDELTEEYLLFLDQFIAVLKLLVENNQVNLEDVMSIDISSTMLSLATFIARFSGVASHRVKIKFCTMCDSVCGRTDTLTLRKDSGARHNILDIVLDWMQIDQDPDHDSAHLHTDLNMACLRTCVKLLDRLQLRPLDGSSTGDDSMHVMSRLFNKYSSALLHGLEICQLDIPSSDSVSDLGSLHQKMRFSQRESELRELVITGLAHLVSANTESGFKQCLPLAYDQDNRKRTIFARVFARVIGQGTKFDPEDRSAAASRHARLIELVRGYEMALAMTICEICPPGEVEIMISVLLNLFNTRKSLMALLKLMIEREVAQTDNEANLFRSNSTCTRFLSAFARIHGYTYLRSLIQPLIKTMASLPAGQGYEVDPAKIPEADLAQNQKNVQFVASNFLQIISSSIPALPSMFREICAHIAKVVAEVWPGSKHAAIGAFIFLRFISPAVVAPEIVDVELPKGDLTVLRRGLMVIAKIIQNLANNIFFGKEAHMVVLNGFLRDNIANVTRFLNDLHKHSVSSSEEEDDEWLGTTSDDTDSIVLHRFFDKHADKIGKELLSLSKPSSEGESVSGKRAWDGLCALLVDLGSPLEVPRCSLQNSTEHREYLDLISRYAHRDTEPVWEIFQETDVPQGQSAVFVLHLSKIDVETLDIELLMYHIFKLLALPNYRDRQFEIILDCTSFTSISEVPLQWLKYCAELIPSDLRFRFATTHILNPNALTQKYLRRLYNVSAGTPFCGEIRAYSSVAELKEHIPQQALSGLAYPISLEEEQREVFREVTTKVMPHVRMPIILEVGSTHLRITSVKTQPISPGLSCKSIEIIPFSDVSDIYNISTGQELNEFIIRRNRHGETVYFLSPERDSIIMTIRSAKSRLKEVHIPLTERFSRFSNVPATLLHVGLMSIDPHDEELRASAYDLLGGVCTYLNYDKSPIIACKAGFIPGDPNMFVVQLSERIAEFAPQLTLDFISEVSAAMNGMGREATAQQISCLQYMSPWIKNLAQFANPTSSLYERSAARLRDCVRVLADLSVSFPEISSTIQRCIWSEVSKMDSIIVDIILDELVRAAIDGGGIGSRRCETIAHVIACVSSIGVRGRIYSRLRKALSKATPKIANSLLEHANWNEISTLIRLALIAGSQGRNLNHHQLYVPEVIHLVNLVAGVGPPLVRKSVYGIVMNLLQSLYLSRTEDTPAAELLQLINDCMLPEITKLFGLVRDKPTSEYANFDSTSDKQILENHEKLTQLLVRIMDVTAGTRGLLNVWRARWMSLVTSTAFQLSPPIQMRSFIALGTLATAEVDDDFLYQILVALRNALSKANETHTLTVVGMLQCLCKLVPALQEGSRYLVSLFWLAVALLQCSHVAFYPEATRLLQATLESMERQDLFRSMAPATLLLDGRSPLEEITSQLDEILKLSFDSNFSFSLASVIFKGVRHTGLRDCAESVLRCLLQVTVRSYESLHAAPNGFKDTLCADALGYFIALLPLSTTPAQYQKLLQDCKLDEAWFPDAGLAEGDESTPRVSPTFLGVNDSTTALLVSSFVGTMLMSAQGDDTETEILYCLLADVANLYPDVVTMVYDGMSKRVEEAIASSSNASIIRSVSNIFRVAMLQDTSSRFGTVRGSGTTLNTVEEFPLGNRNYLNALDEFGMQGLANNFQFLPPNRGHATKMINWIPGLVTLMMIPP
ncbi:hypothetical protein BDN72DRAFT_964371 [Pluteus cervinus]|uniref:Uncharacterized protein n=1 Tax=Pluteus cervinus TaxID=181527 RepID=A0ACD3ACZ7_9AGAR|nr:hypothetical protein BDN72DRAFT_964371 [Pluteus cervinus]